VAVNEQTIAQAMAGDARAFGELTEPYRRELRVHCYRILGSAQDAEDVLQETLLAAWQGLDRLEQATALRAWLYRIATNRCLNALRDSRRRSPELQVPVALPREAPQPTRLGEPSWVEPYPDALLEQLPDSAPGPDARYLARESLTLAFVTALQHLTPAQRAAMLLRDVLGFRAAEVATMLDSTEDSVNSALKRARAVLQQALPSRERAPAPDSPAERRVVERFVEAFERGDIDAIVALLTDDAWLTMPPMPLEYQGRDAAHRFLTTVGFRGNRSFKLVATRANTQPAFGCYTTDLQTPIARAHGLLVLTLQGSEISAVTRFLDNSLLPQFGLPRTLRL
jgi:RNA polymerase sigma-70 factor (ECF subfamily)